MPPQACPRCQRLNPADAVYCYFDGNVLRHVAGGAGQPVPGQLPREFVFPSGRRCRTLETFVQGCQYEWEDARDLLRRGDFISYFTAAGRADLARSAREAQGQADPDVGLHNFLAALPATQGQGPSLDLKPRRIVLGKLRPGEARQMQLQVLNQGKGLLQGKLTVAEGGQWLRIEAAAGLACDNGSCTLKTAREQAVTLRIDTRGLPAPQSYSARLTVITNGGIAEVPVRLDLGTLPFPRAPFQGAATPREMAERMRTNPKAAVPLLESGEIQSWFTSNGWAYPVMGVPARGVASVQQFFEAMGLSKPPAVQLSESEVHCLCIPPEVQPRQVILRTPAKKWIYAQADSDVPWLRVTTPNVAGAQQAVVAFEVDSTLMDAGMIHEGRIQIVANAGQALVVRVRADVRKPQRPFTRRLFGSFLALALVGLLYRVLFALPGDLFARVWAAPGKPPEAEVKSPPDETKDKKAYEERWLEPGSRESWLRPATREKGYLGRFVLATCWVGPLLGTWLLWRRTGRPSDAVSGAVAGTMGGAGVAVTLACLMSVLDGIPRQVLGRFGDGGPAAGWTLLWLVLVVLWWAVLVAGVGVALQAAGQRGRRLLTRAALPWAWLLQTLGMKRAAAAFAF